MNSNENQINEAHQRFQLSLTNKDWLAVRAWLEWLHSNQIPYGNYRILAVPLVPKQEIRPPLKSESELVQLQNEINCKLQEGRFDGLNIDFDQIHRSLKYDTGVNWQIEIKLQRIN